MAQLAKIHEVFSRCNEHNVVYCHWKSIDHLEATYLGDTDIDALFARNQRSLIETILVDCGFVRLDTVVLRAYPGIMDYVALDEESGKWVHLHLHYQLLLGDRWVKAYHLPLEQQVLENAVYSDRYQSYVVHPSDELYLLCARMALKLRRPFRSRSVQKELAHIQRAGEGQQPHLYGITAELDEMVSHAKSAGLADGALLNRYARRVRKSLARYRRYSWWKFAGWSAIRCVYRYSIEFRRRILKRYGVGRRRIPSGGIIVAFVGPDGSGKTSAVARMEQQFAQQMNVTRVFLGNGRSGAGWIRRAVFSLLGAKAKMRGHRQYREGKSTRKPPWYYSFWMAICVRDKMAELALARSAKGNGGLVLSDRWPQSEKPGVYDGPRLDGESNWAANYEKKFYLHAEGVRPDLLFRFNVTPEKAALRKPGEIEIDKHIDLVAALNSIEWPADEVVDVDADMNMEEVDRFVREAIWQRISSPS